MIYYRFFVILSALLLFDLSIAQSAISNSLSDCQTIASEFQTTISYTATNITGTTGVNVTCAASGIICPGQTINGVCVWQRKLSAVCRNASGIIKIRIQTNGFPPRCANVPMGSFVELNVDFEVNFYPAVSINSFNENLTSLSTLSQTICTVTSASTVPSASGFVNYGTTGLSTASGVSVDGVMIFTPDSVDNVDPFYPPSGSAESVDSCLAHWQVSGTYHYHTASGCKVNPPTGNITACAANSACSSSVANYSIALFSSYQIKTVIGIAKDGHIIYGPYLSANTRVPSGFDVCNGMFHDSNGNYAYFATSTYPYLVGCFGPGNYPSFGPNCTTNGPSNYTMSSYAVALMSNSSTSTTSTTSTTSSMHNTSTTTTSTTSTTSFASNSSTPSTSKTSTTSAASASSNATASRTTSTSVRLSVSSGLLVSLIVAWLI